MAEVAAIPECVAGKGVAGDDACALGRGSGHVCFVVVGTECEGSAGPKDNIMIATGPELVAVAGYECLPKERSYIMTVKMAGNDGIAKAKDDFTCVAFIAIAVTSRREIKRGKGAVWIGSGEAMCRAGVEIIWNRAVAG